MIQVIAFPFNPFQVNTYLIFDNTRECIIIDPSCYEPEEQKTLAEFIESQNLQPVKMIFTHGHVDHLLGAAFVSRRYRLKGMAHKDTLAFFEESVFHGRMFGFDAEQPPLPEYFPEHGDSITAGMFSLKVLHTPGHAAGSLCFYNEPEKLLISGDVLFNGSIGRSDLPTGNYDTLIRSIEEHLLVLPDEVKVFPGHGPATTIGHERLNNPFF